MKKTLLIILVLSFVVELVLSFMGFFMPATAAGLFKVAYTDQTAFLAYIIAWFLLLATALIGYIVYLLLNNKAGSKALIYLLGFWWIGLGVGVYIAFSKIDNLLLDSAKGLLIVALNFFYHNEQSSRNKNVNNKLF
jgi:hypothetical protein